MHGLGICHRDVKPDNIVLFDDMDSGGVVCRRLSDKKKLVAKFIDFGIAVYKGVYVVENSQYRDFDSVLHQTNPDGTMRLAGTAAKAASPVKGGLGSPRAAKLLESARTVAEIGSGGQPFEDGIQTVSLADIHEHTCCAPSAGTGGHSPKERVRPYGTETYSPPEKYPKSCNGHYPSCLWMPGDMWGLGIILADILCGSPKGVCLSGTDWKKLFAEATDQVLWHKFLCKNKLHEIKRAKKSISTDQIPDEWKQAIEFLRALFKIDPAERLTAAQAVRHPFLKLADLYHS